MRDDAGLGVLLSIVIANYNYGRFLEEAIQSVVSQIGDFRSGAVELIVIDGGSTDNSLEIIKRHENELAYWVSEKDNGQSDALNKGFAKARGRFLTWLNADDVFVSGALAAIVREVTAYPDCEWFTANFYRFIEATKKISEIGWGPHVYPKWMQHRTSPVVAFGPSAVFSKALWERAGRLDESMHLIMDTDLWMRFIVMGVKQRRITKFVWAFRMHESSKTAEFGDHRITDKRVKMFEDECRRSVARTGYRMSRHGRLALLLLRLIDGSLLRRYYYANTMIRHV